MDKLMDKSNKSDKGYTTEQCDILKTKYCDMACYNIEYGDNDDCDDLQLEWDEWLGAGVKNCGSHYGPLGKSVCTTKYQLIDKYGLISVKTKPLYLDYVNNLLTELESFEKDYDNEFYIDYIEKVSKILSELMNNINLNLNIHELDTLKNMYEDKFFSIIFALYPDILTEIEDLSSDFIYNFILEHYGPDVLSCISKQMETENKDRILQIMMIIYLLAEKKNIQDNVFNLLLTGNICLTGQYIRLFMILIHILDSNFIDNKSESFDDNLEEYGDY